MRKHKFKFIVIAIALLVGVTVTPPKYQPEAQLVVFDPAAILSIVAQTLEIIALYYQVVELYNQLKGITSQGLSFEDLLALIHYFFPFEIPAMKIPGPELSAGEVFGAGYSGSAMVTYEKTAERIWGDINQLQEMYQAASDRREKLDELRIEMTTAEDQKAKLDVGNRITAEQLQLTNDLAMINLWIAGLDLHKQADDFNAAARLLRTTGSISDVK